MSSLILKGNTSGQVTIQAPDEAGTTTLTLPTTNSTLATQNALGVRNLIINGDMRIAQRGTSVTGKTTGGYFTVDRFYTGGSTAGTWTISQDTDTPSGQGFATSLKMDCTTANASLSAGSYWYVEHKIEAQNLQHLKFGTASAETLTLSFWVKSNKTGTYTVENYRANSGRHICNTYTINTADTWEKKTITIDADTTGIINNDNGEGWRLMFWVVAGTTFTSGTLASSWAASSNPNRVSSSNVNLADSTSNYINITGVQLEVGDTATPFEHRPYDMELARCQRYYWKNKYNSGNAAPTLMTSAIGYNTTSIGQAHCKLPVTMRASPSSSISSNLLWWNSPSGSITAIATINNTVDVGTLNFTTTGVSIGTVYNIISTTVGAYIDFSAEL